MSTPPRPQASSEAADADGDSATAARRRAAHEQIISRQSTVEFISSLLGGTDTPDAPLEQKFESLPSTAAEMTALAESAPLDAWKRASAAAAHRTNLAGGEDARDASEAPYARERAFLSLQTADVMNTLGPFLGGFKEGRGGDARAPGGALRGRSPGASVAEALRWRARDIEEAEQRDHSRLGHDHRPAAAAADGGEDRDAPRRLRVHSAPEPSARGAPLSRTFENTETHLPAAAVRRTAERQEMRFRNAQQAQQALTAREARAEDGGSAGERRGATGAEPKFGAGESGDASGRAAAAPPRATASAAKRLESDADPLDPGVPLGFDPASGGLARPSAPPVPAPAAAPAPAATPSPPLGARATQTASAAKPPKTKNPKRADRRRTIARFTTAILRAGGSNAFIARDGLGYRKAFDRFLVETYGETFAEGGYWYENARVEPFFRVLFHVATDGRVRVDHDVVNALFCKREKRQAAEWLLDEEELSKFGVTATQLAQIFEGPPSVSPTGYPRGTPLAIPTDIELDSGAFPGKNGGAAAAAAQQMMRHAPGHAHAGFGAHGAIPGNPRGGPGIPVAVAVRGEEAGNPRGKEGAPGERGPANPGGGRPYDSAMAAAAAVAAAGGQTAGYSQAQIQYAQALARRQAQHQELARARARGSAHEFSSPGPGPDSSGHHPLSGLGPPGSNFGNHLHAPPGFAHMAHGLAPGSGYAPPPLSMFPPVSLTAGAYGAAAAGPGAGAPGGGGVAAAAGPPDGTQPASFGPHARVPSFGYLDPVGSGPRRQYSSDLSRLMSEFNANPTTSDDFLKSFIQRSASELDVLASLQSAPGNPKPS